jgi:hypothetical protein
MLNLLVVTASMFGTIIMFIDAYLPTVFHTHVLDLTFSRECLCCSLLVMTLCSPVDLVDTNILDENISFNFHTEGSSSMLL